MSSSSNAAMRDDRRVNDRLASEVADRKAHPVPLPNVVLEGSRWAGPYHGVAPYDPNRPDAPFHAPPIAPEQVADVPWPPSECPTCRGRAATTFAPDGDPAARIVRYCEACGSMGDPWEANAATQRKLHEARERSEAAGRDLHEAALDVAYRAPVVLAEVDRRRLWNGHARGSRLAPIAESLLSNFGLAARRWLVQIGQAPDWDLVLDGRGNVLGRWSESFDPEAAARAA